MYIKILEKEIDEFVDTFHRFGLYQNLQDYKYYENIKLNIVNKGIVNQNIWRSNPCRDGVVDEVISKMEIYKNSKTIYIHNKIKDGIIFCHTGAWDYLWQHFMQDVISMIRQIIKHINNDNMVLLLPFKTDYIDFVITKILKISNRIYYVNDNNVQVDKLYIPSFDPQLIFWKGLVPYSYRKEVSMLFNNYYDSPNNNKLLYLSRRNCGSRKVLNEFELIDYLKVYCINNKLEFVDFVHENYSNIEDRFAIFNEAKIVIAPHGGAIYHIYACKPYTKMIEFVNTKGTPKCSAIHFAPFIDMDYTILFNDGTHSGEGYNINIKNLDKILKNEDIMYAHQFNKSDITFTEI